LGKWMERDQQPHTARDAAAPENISLLMEKADISATSRGSQKKGLVHLPAPECSVYRRYKVRG
jgi:hypothetical protein